MRIPLKFISDRIVETDGLIDTGAGELFVDYRYAKMKNMPMKKLPQPIRVFNADGTGSAAGALEEYVEVGIAVGMHEEDVVKLVVTALGSANIYLGHD